ncbi:sortase-dependent protein [Streptomyces fuscichromogenes]|uniref:sortase-dependent protein n=1 Tax=Streptomyces fuscichromogenes TaxID=1324013 RepID=UPI00382590E7
MRRTVLSAAALACTAVLAGTVPAFADGTSARPVATAAPSAARSAAPSAVPSTVASPVASAAPTRDSHQVAAVPRGAADTGVTEPSSDSGTENTLIGGGAAAVLAAGVAVFAVRRRRATGA